MVIKQLWLGKNLYGKQKNQICHRLIENFFSIQILIEQLDIIFGTEMSELFKEKYSIQLQTNQPTSAAMQTVEEFFNHLVTENFPIQVKPFGSIFKEEQLKDGTFQLNTTSLSDTKTEHQKNKVIEHSFNSLCWSKFHDLTDIMSVVSETSNVNNRFYLPQVSTLHFHK